MVGCNCGHVMSQHMAVVAGATSPGCSIVRRVGTCNLATPPPKKNQNTPPNPPPQPSSQQLGAEGGIVS